MRRFTCPVDMVTWFFSRVRLGAFRVRMVSQWVFNWNAKTKTAIWRRCNWESKDWYLDLPFCISISSVLLSSPQCAKCSGNLAGQGRVYMHTQWAARLQHGMFGAHGYFVSKSDSTQLILRGESPVKVWVFGRAIACVDCDMTGLSGAYALTRGNTPIHTPPDGAMDGFHHWDKSLRRYLDRCPGMLGGGWSCIRGKLHWKCLK